MIVSGLMHWKNTAIRAVLKILSVPEMGALIPLIGFALLFNYIRSDFLAPDNIPHLIRANVSLGIVIVGSSILMIAGEIDLSVGSVATLCGAMAAWAMKDLGIAPHLAVIISLAIAMLAGLINGILTVKVGVPAFFTTLGMFFVARGLSLVITEGKVIFPLPASFNAWGSGESLGQFWSVWIFLGLVLVADILMRRTTWGAAIYATGGNRRAAQVAGIRTDLVKILCFVLCSTLAGIAGILATAHLESYQLEIGLGWELDAIASAVIGGCSLFGGIGTIAGAAIGVFVMQVLKSGIAMSAANANLQTVLIGMIMLAAVVVDVVRRRGKQYREPEAEQIAVVGGLRKWLRVPELGILGLLVTLTLVFGAFKPVFLEPSTFATLLRAGAYVAIISVGWTFLLVAGEIDLSVGATAAFSSVFCALLMTEYGWSILPSVLTALLVGTVIGLINGLVSVKVGVPAFITTIAMAFILQGLALLVSGGYPVYPLPEDFNSFGNANPAGVSWAFWIAAALVILGQIVLSRTIWGARVSATGGNKMAARVAGINTDRVKIVCFTLVGTLAALAGILAMARVNRGEATLGMGWNLDVIAGVALGGGSLSGGLGTVAGAFMGVLVMQVLRGGIVMTGLNYFWQSVAVGLVMLLAVTVDNLGKRRRG